MPHKKLQAVKRAFERLNLEASNTRLAAYWLSLWSDGKPPHRADFNPARAKEHLEGVALFEVFQDGPIVCRLAGTAIDRGLGFSLTGQDFMSFLPKHELPVRRRRLNNLVDGAIAVARTPFQRTEGEIIQENLLLPFRGVSEAGSRQFLLHTNVRPTYRELLHRPREWNAGLPKDYTEFAF